MSSFAKLKLPPEVIKALAADGLTDPTEVQSAVMDDALKGRDVLVCSPTGSGKTAAFLLPLISRLCTAGRGSGTLLVLEPSRELAAQVSDCARRWGTAAGLSVLSVTQSVMSAGADGGCDSDSDFGSGTGFDSGIGSDSGRADKTGEARAAAAGDADGVVSAAEGTAGFAAAADDGGRDRKKANGSAGDGNCADCYDGKDDQDVKVRQSDADCRSSDGLSSDSSAGALGKVSADTDNRRADRFQNLSADIVVSTPGRLLRLIRSGRFPSAAPCMLVIDEADRMLDMGLGPQVSSVARLLKRRGQTLLLSATLSGRGVRDFAETLLRNPAEVTAGGDRPARSLPPGLRQTAYLAADEGQKLAIICHLLRSVTCRSIIFVQKRLKAQWLSRQLGSRGFGCACLEGGAADRRRAGALRRFKAGDCRILVATDLAARGLDLPDVGMVINFDLPRSGVAYLHRAGRTARAGGSGTAVCLADPSEVMRLEHIERFTGKPVERRVIKGVSGGF